MRCDRIVSTFNPQSQIWCLFAQSPTDCLKIQPAFMALLGWVDLDSDLCPRSVQSTIEICVSNLTFKF
jgi:hypothetical protein